MSDRSLGRSLVPVAVLALVWGANWPILKLGVAEIEPLTFRALTLPFAGLGLLAIARASGESVRIPRAMWPLVATLALVNITGWNGLVLFGVREMEAGRSAIIAYTMPVWATLVSLAVLHEPLGRRKAAGLAPLARPELEAVETAGGLQVLYSPLGLGCGWEDEACPCCLGYAPASARDLGLNALAYAMAH